MTNDERLKAYINTLRLKTYINTLSRRLCSKKGSLSDVIVLRHLRESKGGACQICDDTGVIQRGYLRGFDCICQDLTDDETTTPTA